MNYEYGENDQTDIQFKSLSIIDQSQIFYLDINNQRFPIKCKKDTNNQGSNYTWFTTCSY